MPKNDDRSAAREVRQTVNWPYWACQTGGWAALWLAEVVEIPDLSAGPVYPQALFIRHAIFYGSALFLTHAWRWVIRRHGWAQKPLSHVWWRALAATFLLSCIHNALNTGLLFSGLPDYETFAPGTTALIFGAYWLLVWIEFTAWTGIYLGYHAYRQLQELRVLHAREESARKSAALQALKAQVKPHFLFNSLNTIRSLISDNPERAREAVTHLAQMLRGSLDTDEQPLIPLSQELEVVGSYLRLEQFRHEERLRVEMEISPDSLECLIPPFVVQTLVENAVKHGIEHLPEGGTVRVTSRCNTPGLLEILVTHPGGIRSSDGTGLGLPNARNRLGLLGGGSSSLELSEDHSGENVTATVRFPQPVQNP